MPREAVAVLVLHDEALLDEARELDVRAFVVSRLLCEPVSLGLELVEGLQPLLDLQLLLFGPLLVGVDLLLGAAAF